jgi:outer membrane receptor protein involved in Fe transport
VHPDNFHNRGDVVSAAAHVTAVTGATGVVRITAGAARSRYDVPHGETQDDAGQDQRQKLSQVALSGSWQRPWSDSLASQVAVHGRTIDAALLGSAADTPVRADSRREHQRIGIVAGLTHARGRHTLKAGMETARLVLDEDFAFAVTDAEQAEEAEISDAAAQFTPANPFHFRGHANRMQWGLYVQDSVHATDAITLDFGVRFDRTNLLTAQSQWSPRAGVAWRAGPSTTLRASVNRFFQPPQAEHLLLSSSPEARALSPFAEGDGSEGGADLLAERQTAIEAGIEHWVGGTVRVDAAYWNRSVRNYADPNVFFGTTIIFPNSVASGTARGLDVQLQLPRYRGWSSYASYTLSRVVQVGPINGGLFLEDNMIDIGAGTEFTPDHDQRHVASAGLTYQHAPRGFAASLAMRYESGTPLEVEEDNLDELMERPGAELVNFETGRVRPRTLLDVAVTQALYRGRRFEGSVRLSLLNVMNSAYALNFGNPFSGTHFGAPRTLRLDIRIDRRP